MQIISKKIDCENFEYYLKYLQIVNIILPVKVKMSEKEMEVLAAFLSLEESLIEDDIFNGVARKKVMAKLGLTAGGLGNHLRSLINNEYLTKNKITKRIKIKPYLIPEKNNQGFRLKLLRK